MSGASEQLAETGDVGIVVTKPHDDLRPDTFHEWIRDSRAPMVGVDRRGRRNPRMIFREWQPWRCNNLDCEAEALVSEVWIEDQIVALDTSIETVSTPEQMPLADLMRDYADGEGHGWQAEFDWLDTHHAARMDRLTTSIQETGIQTPILLGNDGRVWDGHHRIAAAHRLAIDTVPVVVTPTGAIS